MNNPPINIRLRLILVILFVGAATGLAGGLIYDTVKKNEQSAYEQGYAAGRSTH